MAHEYRLKTGFKIFFVVLGIIALPIFLAGVPVLLIAFRAYAKTDEKGFEYRWLTVKRVEWADIAEVRRAPAAGLLGALMAPHTVERLDGKPFNFPSGTFTGGGDIVELAKSHVKTPEA
jgi:hypothetical protein